MADDNVGLVETKFFSFVQPPQSFILKSGVTLAPITIAYETYGQLNTQKSNAIMVFHALTGDAHAAGYHTGENKPGWWDMMIGPGKAFDTNKYFVICSNVIGSCRGSTGPSSINPQTNETYGLSFPIITIQDMVQAQRHLLDYLGVERLLCAAGGSMGGFQALQWSVAFPDRVASVISIASNSRHGAQQIALHEVARQAIMADPDWQKGNYYGKTLPARGLAVARMIGHITYMSEKSMEEKFGRKLTGKERLGYDFSNDFEVESYLRYRGDSFVQRFDANSFLYLSKALDYFDLAEDGKLVDALAVAKASYLIISFSSDWLYPSHRSKELVRALKINDLDVSDIEISSSYGHDAFLLETEDQTKLISHFLNRISKSVSYGKK